MTTVGALSSGFGDTFAAVWAIGEFELFQDRLQMANVSPREICGDLGHCSDFGYL